MAPDLDVLIRSAEDSLLVIEYHRHFTHALAFIPIGALLCAAVGWPLFRRWLSFGRLYLYCFMGFSQGGLLDACTSYGTQLFWPFSDERVAWSIIAIIDPLFTGVLIILLGLAIWKRQQMLSWIGIIFALSWLSFGWVQRERAEAVGREIAALRGDEVIRLAAKPTIFNNVLFRVIYETPTHYQTDAVRVGWGGSVKVYYGEVADRFDPAVHLPDLDEESVLYRDLQRFAHFSDQWVFIDAERSLVLGDFRYSLMPDKQAPLWGIYYDPDHPDQHVRFSNFRTVEDGDLERFRKMVRGERLNFDPLAAPSPH